MATLQQGENMPAREPMLQPRATFDIESPKPVAGYSLPPQQSFIQVMQVLVQKHFLLSIRRRRFMGLFFRVIPSAVLPVTGMMGSRQGRHDITDSLRDGQLCMVMPLYAVLLLMAVFNLFVIEVVMDKELKMRYVQEVSGVWLLPYWLSYYIYYFIYTGMTIVVYLAVVTSSFAPFYVNSNIILLFAIMVISFLQLFFLKIVVCAIFERAKMAATICSLVGVVGLVIGIFGYLVATKAFIDMPQYNSMVFFLMSLIPFWGTTNIFKAVGYLEMKKVGFTFATWSSPSGPRPKSFQEFNLIMQGEQPGPPAGDQFMILIAATVAWAVFALWFDQVWQGEFGAAKPFCFCFMPEHICPKRSAGAVSADNSAIQLDNLVKIFGSHHAVDGMTLRVERGEIFALLGHNGAGKTTAINCITGMYPITSGTIRVCGLDVSTDLTDARRHLSVCPQDNPLYLEYTCEEHLRFFAALRGVPASSVSQDIDEFLNALGIVEKRNARAMTLSGGQKRRLWVATSLLGTTPVVFLDEPTSGMDPANRRKLWDLLVTMKNNGRCILFTTHYLDEADVLAERKAVLDQGKVKAVGSSYELKKKFGLGYHFRIACDPSVSQATDLELVIKSHIPAAYEEMIPEEEQSSAPGASKKFAFILPFDEVAKFGELLQNVENEAQRLKVRDFAMETTSLEEVFLSLGSSGNHEVDHTALPVRVIVPDGYNARAPVQIPHPETGVLTTVRLPDGSAPGMQVTVYLPRANQHVVNLAPQSDRVPVTFVDCLSAVFMLRNRQVWQAPRSLIATFIVPLIVEFLMIWAIGSCLGMIIRSIKETFQGEGAAEMAELILERVAPLLSLFATLLGLVVSVVFATALPYYATTLVTDRVQRCTYAVSSQGLPSTAYWLATFLQNYAQMFVLTAEIPVVFAITGYPMFDYGKLLGAVVLAPITMLLFAYNASRLFPSTEGCSKFMPGITLLASTIPFLAVFIFGLQASPSTPAIHWINAFINPFYCMPGTFVAVAMPTWFEMKQSGSFDGNPTDGPIVEFPKIAGEAVLVPLVGQLCLASVFALLLTIDLERLTNIFCFKLRGQVYGDSEEARADIGGQVRLSYIEDNDVKAHEQALLSADSSSMAVLYKGLVQTYNAGSAKQVRAVRGISLGVQRGECFCLLGPNGAGKTTTLDVLTGAIYPPTRGEVSINGFAITASASARLQALQSLGNCPQVDPLWPTLTGRQHLIFYASVKGLPAHIQTDQVNMLLNAMGFSDFDADKPTQGYSGGMKRKLSLAIALIGSPPTLLLDEPSAAVDAAAKRHLWKVVKQRGSGQSVILTTHSMEEAEALSDRLGIQVKGRLRCIGTPDHIKNTHGAGYHLEVIGRKQSGGSFSDGFKKSPSPEILKFVTDLCPSSQMMEFHEGRYLFQIPVLKSVGAGENEMSVAALFLGMQNSSAAGIQDYSISRPSLEQVFLRFSKEQQELDAAD